MTFHIQSVFQKCNQRTEARWVVYSTSGDALFYAFHMSLEHFLSAAVCFPFVIGFCVGKDSLHRICATIQLETIFNTLIRGEFVTLPKQFDLLIIGHKNLCEAPHVHGENNQDPEPIVIIYFHN